MKEQTYRAKPRHRTSYPRGAPVEAHYRQCNRSKRSQTRPTTPSNEQVQVKMSGLKGKRCDSTDHTAAPMTRVFLLFCSVSTFSFKFCFASGKVTSERILGNSEISVFMIHDEKSTKNQITLKEFYNNVNLRQRETSYKLLTPKLLKD